VTPGLEDRLAGAAWGLLVGDAMGVPYEFEAGPKTVEWGHAGTWDQPPGTWSDDGALMLALLDSLLTTGFDPEDQARRELDLVASYRERTGSGYVVDCLWSTWDAFNASGDYRAAIERAIKYGNDTDTTAAVAGGLAGAWYGIGAIPAEWLAGMRGADIVAPLLARIGR